MTNQTALQERTEKLVSTLDIKSLQNLWIRTNKLGDKDGKHILREMIMDRLENINIEAFDVWLDASDNTDFSMFY